jgi:hypothetical protein
VCLILTVTSFAAKNKSNIIVKFNVHDDPSLDL